MNQDVSAVVAGVERPYELYDEDVRALLEASLQLHQAGPDLDQFPLVVFDLIKRLIGADVVGYGEIDPASV